MYSRDLGGGARQQVPALERRARALVGGEDVAPVARQPGVVREAAAGREARELADGVGLRDVERRQEPVADRRRVEPVAAPVAVVHVEVGEAAELARVRGVGLEVEHVHPALGPVGVEQAALLIDVDGMRRSEGLVPGADLRRAIGVVQVDDVEPGLGLGRDVGVLAVGLHLAPRARAARDRARDARAPRVRHVDDREAGRCAHERQAPAARRGVAPVPGSRGHAERREVEVRAQRHVEARGPLVGRRRRGRDGRGGRCGRRAAARGERREHAKSQSRSALHRDCRRTRGAGSHQNVRARPVTRLRCGATWVSFT